MLKSLDISGNGERVAEDWPLKRQQSSLRSESIQDIISRKPSFWERWAILLFLIVLSALFGTTWFISYPDVVQASAILSADNAPKEIVIRQDGKLIRLFVVNEAKVLKGQTIGWIESTAVHGEVISLSKRLSRGLELLSANKTEGVSILFRDGQYDLGELQVAYQQFIIAYQQFDDYLVNGYYFKRKSRLCDDLVTLQKLHKTIEQQKLLTEQDLRLSEDAFDADSSLYREKVISRQDLRDQDSKVVSKRLTIPQLDGALLSNESAQIEKLKDIEELEHTITQQKTIFEEALLTLKSLADDWKRKFLITAPIDGKVVFVVPLQENQYMQNGKTIGYINPPDSRYFAQITLPQNNFGKIVIGQKVQLRVDAYPYQEFGFIPGVLTYISRVPSDSGFLATAELPRTLLTSYGKVIQYRSGLKSEGLIVTRKTRLIDRFLFNVRKKTSIN